MKKKKSFIQCVVLLMCVFTTCKPFNFNTQEILFYTSQDFLELLKNNSCSDLHVQNLKKDFLWHLSLPTIGLVSKNNFLTPMSEILLWDIAPKKGRGVKIAILDTDCDRLSANRAQERSEQFKLCDFFQIEPKTRTVENSLFFEVSLWQKANRCAERTKKNHIFKNNLKLNHAEITYEIIKQLAPESDVVLIPILDEHGFANKQSLLQGLQKAVAMKADIVHLGLKSYESLDKNCALDKEIKRILQKLPYVVAAAGNDGTHIKKLAYPACLQSIFFSVGAFEYKNGRYVVSDFSQSSDDMRPNFIMPGRRILCPVWCKEISDYVFVHTVGTSMAAAMMSGFLALVLSEHASAFSKKQIMSVIKECSKKLDTTWKDKVNLGTIHMRETMMMLSILKSLNKKCIRTEKHFFKSINHIKNVFKKDKTLFKIYGSLEEEHKENVKNFTIYANSCFYKKIDRDLCILVQDSIYALKENIWKKKHI